MTIKPTINNGKTTIVEAIELITSETTSVAIVSFSTILLFNIFENPKTKFIKP